MDVEMLSASARGDASELLGQFGALLIFGSVVSSLAAVTVGQSVRHIAMAGPIWAVERFLIALNMLVVAVFALLSWDSSFPDRRDVLLLAPLPIRGRMLFAAKIAAAASALGLVMAAWNSLAAFAWPLVMAPAESGAVATIRFVAAFWVALAASGAFTYCVVLGVQGVAAQLPRRWYLRASSVLQIAAFVLILGVFCFEPSLSSPQALAAPENQRALAWLPSYWFLGLLSELSGALPVAGHAVMPLLAYRAVAGLAIAMVASGGAFLLSYFRTLRKIVEEPDVAPGSRGGMWLPPFGSAPQTALAQFVIRTMLRSRQHRAMVAFYLGGGLALVAVYLEGTRQAMHLTWADTLGTVSVPMLVACVLMLCAAWLGTRTVFSLPLDIRANWLFHITPTRGGAGLLPAVRRSLLALSVFPVLTASAALLLWFWPWTPAAEHLLLLWILGSVLVDISLLNFRKIPFTCSYLPGKSKAHLVFWFGVIPVVIAIHQAAGLERDAMRNPLTYWSLVAGLGAAAVVARWASDSRARRDGPAIQFEESASDEVIGLGLNR